MNSNKFSISKRLKSFVYAFNGLVIFIREECNAKIHLIAAILAISLGFVLNISINEWLAVIFSIGLVISMELLNSAIESLADFVSTEKHELIKKTKDLAAGGVLWSAIVAFTVAAIVFIPKIWQIIK